MAEPGYRKGVAMGGDLSARPAAAKAPVFMIAALRDPREAPLQRIQIIKGWLDGTPQEAVFDAACSNGQPPNAQTHRCDFAGVDFEPDVCAPREASGAAELRVRWQDPDFDPAQRAFYYVRVLQIPTCRWSTYDAARSGMAVPAHLPRTIQERAITSPIWYTPQLTRSQP
ncbi:MAG: DUF3604 domain-containing protein [Gammaproteobacteria bacterium]|nr:DUF3604 domain-containing protein [Gammaproteobacteria bacterium]